MDLRDLGFNRWFRTRLERLHRPEHSVARVTAVDRDRYLVRNERNEVLAELTGKLMFSAASSQDLPCVGDWVFVQYHNADTFAVIHELFPRRTVLIRKAAGKRVQHQLIASNVDVAFVVQSCDSDFNLRRLERYVVVAKEAGIEPVFVLSKRDLISGRELEQRKKQVEGAGFTIRTLAVSNLTRSGLDELLNVLERGKTYCLLGSSGVGKTTLLNQLLGREAFKTKAVRKKDGKGRHATARRQLVVLDNGAMFIDNPGMRELGLIGASSGIEESFSDIVELSKGCRFRDCTHTSEVNCSVLTAIEQGELSEERYRSYLKLRKESEYHQMSYVEKRKKDREFGRFVKSVMKHKKKR
ncbi:MAG: ribosome small subunit-dependent GTPase A [Candidatus Eiseniibacteriota bacterium]|nr:MAG: ribosome small subunit-dependent GTPase A [Candidatus Eisenbacteria bacterium]